MDKEVHPLALQKTRHVNFSGFVQVRAFAEEQHPSAFFKIRQPLHETGGSTLLHAEQDSNMHSFIHVGGSESSDTSTLSTEDGSWIDEFAMQVESSLTISDDEDDEVIDEEECEATTKELCTDEICMLKEAGQQTASSKTESFKIKWSFKRKKRKRQRLKVPQRSRKILLLGDMNCGKSNLITTYCRDRYMERYFPTILHYCHSDAKVLGRTFGLILADTSGRDDFKPLRQCSYFKTDVAILCYSAGDRNTLERIKSYWLPELRKNMPSCPFIIAEAKKDIRDEYDDKKRKLELENLTDSLEYARICKEVDERVVPKAMGAQVAEELGAEGFYSTSARYRVGTLRLFQAATIVAVKKSRRKRQIIRTGI